MSQQFGVCSQSSLIIFPKRKPVDYGKIQRQHFLWAGVLVYVLGMLLGGVMGVKDIMYRNKFGKC